MSDYLDPGNAELLKDFFEEAFAQVQLLEQNIIVLENEPDNRESIDDLFTKTYEPLKNTVAKFRNATQIFGRVTEDQQEGVMKIRMVPISQLFSCFPRLSR